MRLLLDTNVVLDYLGVNEGFKDDAETIIEYAIVGDLIELVSASAITDIYYMARRKFKDSQMAVNLIKDLRAYIKTLPVTDDDIGRAIDRGWKDFEDSVQYTVAETNGVDYIITRNVSDFEENAIPVLTPREFLEFYENLTEDQ